MAKAIVEITGAIWRIRPTEKFGREQRFTRKFFVRELDVKYPNVWGMEMWHDNTMLLNEFKETDVVVCKCVVRGRQYTNNQNMQDSFISLECIEIKKL
jgi:hypothetical protein